MKIKDVESKIKTEIDSIAVPDVMPKIKKTPIRNLLTSETPTQSMQRRLLIAVLLITMLLFIVMTISIFAIIIVPDKTVPASNSYIKVCMDDNTKCYGIISNNNGEVVLVYNELEKTQISNYNGLSTIESIQKISNNVSANITISIQNDLLIYARQLANNIDISVKEQHGSDLVEMRIAVSEDRTNLANYINELEQNELASPNMSIETLIYLYMQAIN